MLCLHGNEVDTSNVVDYPRLRDIVQELNRHQAPPDYISNFGTRLVVDVMNDIKQQKHWIDLLKPEGTAAVPLVLLIDPTKADRIGALMEVYGEASVDSFLRKIGLLGADTDKVVPRAGQTNLQAELMRLLSESGPAGASPDSEDALFQRCELLMKKDPRALVLDATATLGVVDYITNLWRTSKLGLMRTALKWMSGKDKLFEPDDTFTKLSPLANPSIHFLAAGHTHAARALERAGGGFYFNSGTWARLFRITDDWFADDTTLEQNWNALRDGSMETIKARGWIKDDLLHVVRIVKAGQSTVGELCRYDPPSRTLVSLQTGIDKTPAPFVVYGG